MNRTEQPGGKATLDGWDDIREAERSRFFAAGTEAVAADRMRSPGHHLSQEALFTQSNARVTVGLAADGTLRALWASVRPYRVTPGTLGLGPGVYAGCTTILYVGDLRFELRPEVKGRRAETAAEFQRSTFYGWSFLPTSVARCGAMEILTVAFAPLAIPEGTERLQAVAPPGPPGALFVWRLTNRGAQPFRARLVLTAADALVTSYRELEADARERVRPAVVLPRRDMLFFARPFGAAGLFLDAADWQPQGDGKIRTEREIHVPPGGEVLCVAAVAVGERAEELMPTLAKLTSVPPLEHIRCLARFWDERLGKLTVGADGAEEAAAMSRDMYWRCLLDNFNCVQNDATGTVVSITQGAPSHGVGQTWGMDVEPTVLSVLTVCPEMVPALLAYGLEHCRAYRRPPEHSPAILVGPVILAREYVQATGDLALFQRRGDWVRRLRGLIADALALRSEQEPLVPAQYLSDGQVRRRYDLAVNIKVWYATVSMAWLLRRLGQEAEAAALEAAAEALRAAVRRHMTAQGPWGEQFSGGTNLGAPADGNRVPEGVAYYDAEDTTSMLAPLYGFCDGDDPLWVRYHRYARSLWCNAYDPEFDTLAWRWAGGAASFDGTAYLSQVAGCATREEALETLEVLWRQGLDDATGSVFWWPRGRDGKRSLTRCSQGQGAWAWLYARQWLGIATDAMTRTLSVWPRGPLTRVEWTGFRLGRACFDITFEESPHRARCRIRNRTPEVWTVRMGIRPVGGYAGGGGVEWREAVVAAGAETCCEAERPTKHAAEAWTTSRLRAMEARALGDEQGVLFRQFGPPLLWGYGPDVWDLSRVPLALRLLAQNGTGECWSNVTVEVDCPSGWRAAPRAAGAWRSGAFAGGTLRTGVPVLPAGGRFVAPFWIEPEGAWLRVWSEAYLAAAEGWDGEAVLRVPVRGKTARQDVFVAKLTAHAASGRICRRLELQVALQPVDC